MGQNRRIGTVSASDGVLYAAILAHSLRGIAVHSNECIQVRYRDRCVENSVHRSALDSQPCGAQHQAQTCCSVHFDFLTTEYSDSKTMHAMRVYEHTPVARLACTGAHSPRKSWMRPMASCALASLPAQVSKRLQHHCFARECLFSLCSCGWVLTRRPLALSKGIPPLCQESPSRNLGCLQHSEELKSTCWACRSPPDLL